MTPTFLEACEVYAVLGRNYGWDAHKSAWGACNDASWGFVEFMHAWGWKAGIIPMIMDLPENTICEDGDAHIVAWVEVESSTEILYFDWTRRQYEEEAPYPYVTTKESLMSEGWRFEITAEEMAELTRPREKKDRALDL